MKFYSLLFLEAPLQTWQSLQQSFFVYEENGNTGGPEIPSNEEAWFSHRVRKNESVVGRPYFIEGQVGMSGLTSGSQSSFQQRTFFCLYLDSVNPMRLWNKHLFTCLYQSRKINFSLNNQGRQRILFFEIPVYLALYP